MKSSFTIVLLSVLLFTIPDWAGGIVFSSDVEIQKEYPEVILTDTYDDSRDWFIQAYRGLDMLHMGYLNESHTFGEWPFFIEGGAPSWALGIDSDGGVGVGTTFVNLGANLEVTGGQVYLDGGDPGDWWLNPGFIGLWFVNGTDIWDPAPVKFNNGAPTNNLVLEGASGQVGIGTAAPTAKFHVVGNGNARIYVQDSSGVAAERTPFKIYNRGKTRFEIENHIASWTFDNDGQYFNISKKGTGLNEFRVEGNGNGYFRGVSYAVFHQDTSSRTVKEGFEPVDRREMLARVAELPIAEWNYKAYPGERHVGPVAEDFQEKFGLSDGVHLSTVDTSGVALAAIQGLYEVVKEKEAKIEELQRANEQLAERLAAMNEQFAERLAAMEVVLKTQSGSDS